MAAPLVPSVSHVGHHSRSQHRGSGLKNISGNSRLHLTEQEVLADIVVRALWLSFPAEASEDAIAEAASPYFRARDGSPINKRTVKYWLRGETLPSALHLSTLVMMQPHLFIGHWLGRGA